MNSTEDTEKLVDTLRDFGEVMIRTVKERNVKWGAAWNEMRNEGLEDTIHAKAHRLCNCPEEEKRECLIDLLAYSTKRWQRGFDSNKKGEAVSR